MEDRITKLQGEMKSLQKERVDRAGDFATIKFDIRTIQSKVGLPVNKVGA